VVIAGNANVLDSAPQALPVHFCHVLAELVQRIAPVGIEVLVVPSN
jgi:hypothetical protein